jgi:hypothetical protein
MTSRRTPLRNAIVARLQAAVPAVQGRAYSGRLMSLEEQDLPAIVVHTREPEKVIARSSSGWNGFEERSCIVSVVCVAQSFDDIDATLDGLADAVEAALQSWVIPGFESCDAFLLDTASDPPEFEGGLTTGATTLRYQVDYTTPYRDCSNPYVDPSLDDILRSGAYPGGQVTPGCPGGNTGTACPIPGATFISDGEQIN